MLEAKIGLISGAGKGIGREFALSLAKAGYTVVCCSRTKSDLDSLGAEINSFGGKSVGFEADVRDFKALADVSNKIEKAYGKLDFLVVNAGVDLENASVEDSDVEKWEATIEINLVGAYKTVKAFLPLLKKSKAGHIIMVGSGLGHRGLPKKTAYSVSKSAQWMLTRIVAQELMEYDILVNEIIPGPVQTSLSREIKSPATPASFSVEWNKEPKDVVPIVEFLLSQGKNGPTGQSFSLARRDLY